MSFLNYFSIAGDPMANWKKEREWLQHTHNILTYDEQADNISYSAYHASLTSEASEPAIVGGMSPLYEDKSNTVSMIKHGMDNLGEVTEFLNPGQIPILCMDLPLFAIGKTIQWSWPVLYGEDKFVLLLGLFTSSNHFYEPLDSSWIVPDGPL